MSLAIIFVGLAPHTVRLVDAGPSVFDNPNDLYAILGLEKTCNLKEIKSAYRKAAVQYHPDKVQGEAQKNDANSKFILIGQAYSFLLKECEEHNTSFKSAFDENASETPSETSASAPCPFAAAFEILEQFLTAVKAEPEAVILHLIVCVVVAGVCFIAILGWLRWCMGEWAFNALTFSILASLRLVWWAIRNVLALVRMSFVAVIFASLRLVRSVLVLVCMAVVAVCRSAVAGATGAVKVVVCLSNGMVSAVRVRDLGSEVAPVVPGRAARKEATVLPPVTTVDAAPALEIEAVHAPVASEVSVKQARAKPNVPKGGLVQPMPSSRRIRPTPKAQIVNAPLRRSKRIAKRIAERVA
jgi:DnaJ domain